MASKKLKGITIEIDGSTTKLNDALKSTNKAIYSTNSELRELNKALKLDPKNTELLSQKQELLKKSISESTNRLNALKEAQRQMGDYNSLTEEQKENYRELAREIAKSENAINGMNKELKNTGSIDLSKVGDTLKKVGNIAAEVVKKVAQVVTAVSATIGSAVAAGVKSYAELEQNIGGVETLFGDSAQKVIDNASKAYETAGVSANEYMQGVTSFSASLLQSLGGDTSKAADIADMAFRDMSDNANNFGTDMSSIQNAYQGFAKQNYTMLDNLKLGYGGTKTEMERLLSDAEKFSGVKYDINNLSDVYNAIHVVQEQLGVTGTTAEEAATTISGSATSMKAAFDNFLNGSGSPEQLSTAITNFLTNISKVVSELAPGILSGIATLITTLAPQIGNLLIQLLPQLFEAAQNMITSLVQLISQNVEPISNLVTNLFNMLVTFILQNLPMIMSTGIQLLSSLATGIAQSLPTLIPTIINVVLSIITTLLDNLDLIILAGVDLLVGLIEGIMNALPLLISKIPEIIVKLVLALTDPEMIIKLIEAAIKLVVALAKGLIQGIPQLLLVVPKIIYELVTSLASRIKNTNWLDLGKNVLKGILNGMLDFGSLVKDTIKKLGTKITDSIKSFFGIHSPSRLMRDQIGKNLGLGIGLGFEKSMPEVLKDVNNAMKSLNAGIESSFNPVINPSVYNNQQNSGQVPKETKTEDKFNITINNNSKYTGPAENARLVRKELELYNLKYGGA